MDINHLISQYGYAALIVGSMAEGETITLLGGVAAHQGLLKFPLVVIAVALGGMIGDQLLYLLGRRFGGRILRRFAIQKARIRKAQRMIQHRRWLFVIGTGLIGASRLPPRIFLPLNIVGALVWALLFTTIGYLGGEVVGPWLHHLDAHLKHWIWLILAVLVVVAAHWWLRRRESKKKD